MIVQEDFRQSAGTLLEKLKAAINRCDSAICLVGEAYGAEPPFSSGEESERRSYTQWEFIFALERHRKEGMPLFIFLKDTQFPGEETPQNEEAALRQRQFVEFVKNTGLDRGPIETEDKLAVRILHHNWEGPPRVAWLKTVVIALPAVLIASFFAYHTTRSAVRSDDQLRDTYTQKIEAVVGEVLRKDQIVISAPDSSTEKVDDMPTPDLSAFTIIEKKLIWDVRNWKPAQSNKIGEEGSPLTLLTELVIRKDEDAIAFVESPKTSGTDLFIRSRSPFPCRFFAIKNPKIVGDIHMMETQAHHDVSSVPVGQQFSLVSELTYWNSMQTKADLWVGLIGLEGMRNASNLVILPEGKPWTRYWATAAVKESKVRIEPINYDKENYFFIADEKSRRWIYWEVLNPEPDYVYQLRWDW